MQIDAPQTTERPKIMGILNIQSDSFYSANRIHSEEYLLEKAQEMVDAGVDIFDLGAVSSRPGASEVSSEEEWNRLKPAIYLIKKHFPKIPISIDTFRSEIALKSLEIGAQIINDISGASWDEQILEAVAKHEATIILMHLEGNFNDMHQTFIEGDIVKMVYDDLALKCKKAEQKGVKNIWIDPGFGFSKTYQQNWDLLTNFGEIKALEMPILIGISRKRMIFQCTESNAETALTGTIAAHMIALQNGANILRVHDVKAAKETIDIYMQWKNSTAKDSNLSE